MKNVTTRLLLIIILLLGLVSFCKNIISTTTSSNTTTKDSVNVTKPDTEDIKYSNLLKTLAKQLKDYPDAKFSVGYIDRDRTPDLFISTGYSHLNGVKIYLSAYDDFIEVKAPDNSGFGEFGKTIYIPYKSTVCDYAMYYGEEYFTFYEISESDVRLLCSLKCVHRENTEYYIDGEAVSKGKFERNLNEYYKNKNYVSTLEYEESFDITATNIRSAIARKLPPSSVTINKNDKETITLYSKNGKSIEVAPSEKEAYNAKGWYNAPASGKAELLEMLYGTWITDGKGYTDTPFVDFRGEKIDTGWSNEYCSRGRIKSITLVKNNTYKIRETATLVDLEGPDKVINNEFHIYYEGGNEFQMVTDDDTMTTWKYVGTLEDMLNMSRN